MDPHDPRTWPDELVAARNLALAYALGQRSDPAARAAFEGWPSRRAATSTRDASRGSNRVASRGATHG